MQSFSSGTTGLGSVVEALAPVEVVGSLPERASDLAYDARDVVPGALFFCVPGARADGHDFAGAAVGRGAAALVVERVLPLEAPQIVVADARVAMARAADVFFGSPSRDLEVVGVTGTNGKTTTAFILYAILEAAGRRPGLVGTIERRVGDAVRPAPLNTPEAIELQRLFREMVDAGNRSCVVEATSEGSAQRRLDGTRFSTLVFTNLTPEHLNFHGTMEAYFQAKRRLFDGVPAAVNAGDRYGRRLAAELRALAAAPVVTFGLAADADLAPESVELSPSGARIRLEGMDLDTRLRGPFNVENVLAAAAAARLLGVPDEAVAAGVVSVEGVPGRFEALDEGQPFTLIVDYAHTPDSLENVLTAARELAENRVICVFGCGGDRDRAKRPLMGSIAARLADLAIVTSDNPRSEDPLAIIADIVAGAGEDVAVEPDRGAAIARAVELASAGDVVVIAGKGHERGQELGPHTLPWDDRAAAREALRALGTGV